jgi:hypothetical protein
MEPKTVPSTRLDFGFRGLTLSGPHRGVEQLAARRAHNPEVAGSNPAPATKSTEGEATLRSLFFLHAASIHRRTVGQLALAARSASTPAPATQSTESEATLRSLFFFARGVDSPQNGWPAGAGRAS